MTLARVGIPGGLVFQTWQLKELRDKGLIDFYETRPREVILYWRALPPRAKKDIDLDLLAAVPGTYDAPATSRVPLLHGRGQELERAADDHRREIAQI